MEAAPPLTESERINALERRVHDLENTVEAYIWCYQTSMLDTPTLTQAIRKTIGEYYHVTQAEITGANQIGSGKGAGFALRNRTSYDMKLTQIREWVALLMRQCCHTEQTQLQDIYPWCFRTTYANVFNKLKALYSDPKHPDRELWLKLLRLVRDKAHQINADMTGVDDAINSINQ